VQAAAQVTSQTGYTLGGQHYKRVPNGYPADHPRGEWLKYTALHVYSPAIALEDAHTDALIPIAMDHFAHMSPIYTWLRELFAGA
jgi:hypothetical protein